MLDLENEEVEVMVVGEEMLEEHREAVGLGASIAEQLC